MNEKGLIEQVLRIINSNYSNIYVIDILSDKVYSFDFNIANDLVIKETLTYTDFIEVAKRFVYNEDINNYFAAINLNNLELESQKGNQETKVKYRKLCETGEYRYHVNIINYLPFESKKLIFMMSEDVNSRLTDTEEKVVDLTKKAQEYENRLTEETESIGNAIYEINNILDMQKSGTEMKETREYINSVFNRVSNDHPELNKALVSKMVSSANYNRPSILIVDDSSIIRNSLKRIFQNDYDIVMAKNGNEAIDIITKNILNKNKDGNSQNIVGILLDLIMPESNGFVVLDFMKNFNLLNKIPVAIISGDEKPETRRKVYEYDIVDMLEKPFNTDNIRRRISKIITMYMSSMNLQNVISAQNKEIMSNNDTKYLEGLSVVINKIVENIVNSEESIRIKKMVKVLALELARIHPNYGLNGTMIDYIISSSPLYNIGGIAMSRDEIVSQRSIKQSIEFGVSIINSYITNKDELKVATNIVKYSCEAFNGSGYPDGLKGLDIPIEAQITNLAVSILQSKKSFATVIKNITETDSAKFNPDLIDVLLNVKKEIKDI